MPKLWVAGSRDFPKLELAARFIRDVPMLLWPQATREEIEILEGAARGVDQLAGMIAKEEGYGLRVLPAQWSEYGPSAGMVRNEKLCRMADALLALWDGKSRGTEHSIELARAKGIPVVLVEVRED